MKRERIYSQSAAAKPAASDCSPGSSGLKNPAPYSRKSMWRRLYTGRRGATAVLGFIALVISLTAYVALRPSQQSEVAEEPQAAMTPAKAYEAVRPSIVRVHVTANPLEQDFYGAQLTGAGIVLVAHGVILTTLHSVYGAGRISVS